MHKLIITFDPATGAVNITGPLGQWMLCNTMLSEAAYVLTRERLKAEGPQEPPSRIIVPTLGIPPA